MFIRYEYLGAPMIDWDIENFCGYKPISTYYTDFGIAERFGEEAIRDTYKRAIENWGKSIEWITEIVMVLNWKQWEHNATGNDKLVDLYHELWRDAEQYVFDHYDGEELNYFFRTTD